MKDSDLETQEILTSNTPRRVSFNTDKNEYQSDSDEKNTPSI